jgi:hypothetical protein
MPTTLVKRNLNNIKFEDFKIEYLLIDAPDIDNNFKINNEKILFHQIGDGYNQNFTLIGTQNGIAINTDLLTTSNVQNENFKFYVDGNIKIDGAIKCKDLYFDDISFNSLQTSNIKDIISTYNLYNSPFRHIKLNNYNSHANINIANYHLSSNNQNYLNINRNNFYDINKLQFSIKNEYTSEIYEDNNYNVTSAFDLGIFGDTLNSPAIIYTSFNKPIEFHISKKKQDIQNYYNQKNTNYKPSLIIDTSNCLHINDTILHNSNISNIKLNINGSIYINSNIYIGPNYCNLDNLFFKKTYNSFNPLFMKSGIFNGQYIFNSNLTIYSNLTSKNIITNNTNSSNITTSFLNVNKELKTNSLNINELTLNGSNININNVLKTSVINYNFYNISNILYDNFNQYIYNSNIINDKIKNKLYNYKDISIRDLNGIIDKQYYDFNIFDILNYKYNSNYISTFLINELSNVGTYNIYDLLNNRFAISNITKNIFNFNNIYSIISNNIIYYTNNQLINYILSLQGVYNPIIYNYNNFFQNDINTFNIFQNITSFVTNFKDNIFKRDFRDPNKDSYTNLTHDQLSNIYLNWENSKFNAFNDIQNPNINSNGAIKYYSNYFNNRSLYNFNSNITNYIIYSNLNINNYFNNNYNILNFNLENIKNDFKNLLNNNLTFYTNSYIENNYKTNINKFIDSNLRNNRIQNFYIQDSNIYNINYIANEIYHYLSNNNNNKNNLLFNVIDRIDFNNNSNYDIKYRLYLLTISSYTTTYQQVNNQAILSYIIDNEPNYSGDKVSFPYKMSIGNNINNYDKTNRLVIKDDNDIQIKFINNKRNAYIGHDNQNFIISTDNITANENIIFKSGNKNTLCLQADQCRVGINNISPLYSLDVNGDIYFKNKLYTYFNKKHYSIINFINKDNNIEIINNTSSIINLNTITNFNLKNSEIKTNNIKIKNKITHNYDELIPIYKNNSNLIINEQGNLLIGYDTLTDLNRIKHPIINAAMHIKNSYNGIYNNTIIRLFSTNLKSNESLYYNSHINTGLEFINTHSFSDSYIGYSNYNGWYIYNNYDNIFNIGYKISSSNIKNNFITFNKNSNDITINKNLNVNGNINIFNCNLNIYGGDIKINGMSILSNVNFSNIINNNLNENLVTMQINDNDITYLCKTSYYLLNNKGAFVIANRELNYLVNLSTNLDSASTNESKFIIIQNSIDGESFQLLKPTIDIRSIYTHHNTDPKSDLRLSLNKFNEDSQLISEYYNFDIKFYLQPSSDHPSTNNLYLDFIINNNNDTKNTFFKYKLINNSINYFKLGTGEFLNNDSLLNLIDNNNTLLYLKNIMHDTHDTKIILNHNNIEWYIKTNNDDFYIGNNNNIFNINNINKNISINNNNNSNYTFNINNTLSTYNILNLNNITDNSNINYISFTNLNSSFYINTNTDSFNIKNNYYNNIFSLNNNGTLTLSNLIVTNLTILGNVNSNIYNYNNKSTNNNYNNSNQINIYNNNFYLRTQNIHDNFNYTIYLNSINNDTEYLNNNPSVVIDNYNLNEDNTLVLRSVNLNNYIKFTNSNINNYIGFNNNNFIIKNDSNIILSLSSNININNDLLIGNSYVIHNNGIFENLNTNSNNIITHFIKKDNDYKIYNENDLIIFNKSYHNINKNTIARIQFINSDEYTLNFNNLYQITLDSTDYYDNKNIISNITLNSEIINKYTHKFEKIFDINKNNIVAHKHLYTLGGTSIGSDKRIKEDIINIENSLEKINKLQGVLYTNKFTKNRHAGLIAQDVKKIIPEVVVEDDEKILGIEYGNMIGFIVESIKELTTEIKNMKLKLNL